MSLLLSSTDLLSLQAQRTVPAHILRCVVFSPDLPEGLSIHRITAKFVR
jgi:hypothetical protein